MTCEIRHIRQDEWPLLEDFLYEAIFVPEGFEGEVPRSIIRDDPKCRAAWEGFGTLPDDRCLVAVVDSETDGQVIPVKHADLETSDNEADGQVIGACWVRTTDEYGHIDDTTPSFSIAILKPFRGRGIGTTLMREMLSELREAGYARASLSVQKENPAVHLYERVGFRIIGDGADETEWLMVCDLGANPAPASLREFKTASGTVRYWVDDSASAHAGAHPAKHPTAHPATSAKAPWLIFLPGLTADHTLFDAQMQHFSGKANCLVWDAPAHGESRPYPLDFSLDDYARILHDILEAEGIERPILVGQSLGGYVSQAFLELYPDDAAGFVSIGSAPLKRKYYPNWEVAFLHHTKGMYLSIPWALLKPWGAAGTAETPHGRANMRTIMDSYKKREYCELTAHGYNMLADAIEAERPYEIPCPALLLCGEKDHAGDVRPFNRKWTAGEGIPLVWIPGAGHNANVDNPDFVNAQIEKFLEEIGVPVR